MNHNIIDSRLTLVEGRIVEQHDCDAVVDATIGSLSVSGRLAGAVSNAAGQGLRKHCAPLPPLQLGEVMVTPGFRLPVPWIIHLRVPSFYETQDPDGALTTAILYALTVAEAHRFRRIAFSALGVGQSFFPPTIAPELMVTAIRRHLRQSSMKEVRLVLPGETIRRVFEVATRSPRGDSS